MSTINSLTFVSSQSIPQFKAAKLAERIDVKRNPKTNKLFFTYPGGVGAVAVSFDMQKPALISLVRDAEGTEFSMLHNDNQVNTEFSL